MIDHFNMVSMRGLDVLEAQGQTYPGLYNSLSEAIEICKYQVLYNWYFAKIPVAPSSVELKIEDDEIVINDLISVSDDDIVHVHSLEVPVTPVIRTLVANENAIYDAPPGVDGYNPVFVAVPLPTVKYEEVVPDFHGIQSCVVDTDAGFYGTTATTQCLTLYTIHPGKYVIFLGETISNAFIACKYPELEFSDFEQYIYNTYQTRIKLIAGSTQLLVTGTSNLFGTGLQRRFFFQGEEGVLAVTTSFAGVDATPILIRINSTE